MLSNPNNWVKILLMQTQTAVPLSTDLPIWMQRAQRKNDWGALIAFFIGILIMLPMIAGLAPERVNALENYAFRTADYTQSLREGVFYTRWSPHTSIGYGSPIPSFEPPLVGYIPAFINAFITNSPLNAVKITFIMSAAFASLMMYLFVSRRTNALCGIVASAFYILNPFTLYTVPYVLGDLETMLGLAMLPLFLWATDRAFLFDNATNIFWIAVATSFICLSNLAYAIAGGLILLIFYAVHLSRNADLKLKVPLGLALGIGISAVYWLPAWQQTHLVEWSPPLLEFPKYHSLIALFSPIEIIPNAQMNISIQWTLGLPLALALGGTCFTIFAVLVRQRSQNALMQVSVWELFFVISALIFVGLSPFILNAQPLLIGVTACVIAVASVPLVKGLQHISTGWMSFILLFTIISSTAVPSWLSIPHRTNIQTVDSFSPVTQIEYERSEFGISVLPAYASAPSGLLYSPNIALLQDYQTTAGQSLRRLQGNAPINVLQTSMENSRYQVNTQESRTLDVVLRAWPNWVAYLNNTFSPLVINPETGLLQIRLPGNFSGTVMLSLTPSRIEAFAGFIALTTLILTAVITVYYRRYDVEQYIGLQTLSSGEILATVGGIIFVALLAVTLSHPSVATRLNDNLPYEERIGNILANRSDRGIEITAYRLQEYQFTPSGFINITLYWRILRPVTDNFQSRFFIINIETGERVLQTASQTPGALPTRRWATNGYIRDERTLQLPAFLSQGNYVIGIEVAPCQSRCTYSERIAFFDQFGETSTPFLLLPVLFELS